ncbi:OmpA family protein [Defluviimonas sp. WL0024]|uniref:OmpA family protein n=2 Tax=Albidovulum TaxID=205889 RepID=A0ABT3IYE4_9RHOB|nr:MULTISPECIES: OmpA family protein [Defluviimonas]MCU9848573.1 OmpA family protein [Defluviimonas sp. WL0024]MCW3780443.1 OmpA family protein [Defluviimonas salinarum]
MKRLALTLLLLAPAAQAAPTLALPPQAARTAEEARSVGSYALPVGPWSAGRIETLATEGEVSRTAWRVPDPDLTTMGLLATLRDQLREEGFEVLFECDTDRCGGFDFRFGTPVLAEPEMHVDLGDFRFLSARRGAEPTADYVSLLVSRSTNGGYVQMTRVGPALPKPAELVKAAAPAQPEVVRLPGELDGMGRMVLDGLAFPPGTANLADDRFASIETLAGWLKAHPDTRVALLGHTDAVGPLATNITLSRARAEAVMERLVAVYGVDRAQLSADGLGYLSPRASNLTPEGRAENRRVEAMITSTR